MANKREFSQAFNKNVKMQCSSAMVTVEGQITRLYIFGNLCAEKNQETGKIWISTCGWNTATTKTYLNNIENVSVHTAKGVLYLNGVIWNGQRKEVN